MNQDNQISKSDLINQIETLKQENNELRYRIEKLIDIQTALINLIEKLENDFQQL